jgi:catechol 2,3-dioxygenase-like lactoylglutathione lyase family enzyme
VFFGLSDVKQPPKSDYLSKDVISNFVSSASNVDSKMSDPSRTGVKVYGCNHVAIEVDDIKKAVAFYQDVFNLEKLDRGEGDAFFKLGEHQFLAIFEVEKVQPANVRHFGIMVRDEQQLAQVRKKLTGKYKLKLEPPFRCDFRDPWGNRIQVVDLHDESLIWLLPYREVQKAGIDFNE